jgi:hypothetical protein
MAITSARWLGHRLLRGILDTVGVGFDAPLPFVERPARRQKSVDGVVRSGLVSHDVGQNPTPEYLTVNLYRVAEQSDRYRRLVAARRLNKRKRLIEARRHAIEIAARNAALDPIRAALDHEDRAARHHTGQRLRSAHAAETRSQKSSGR